MTARALSTLVLLAGCGATPPPLEPVAAPTASEDVAVYVKSAMDTTADPCVDFYQYACGAWIANTPLPADKPAFARSFSVMADENEKLVHDMMEKSAADAKAGTGDPDWQRMGHAYGACMDEAAIEAVGIKPLDARFATIAAYKKSADLPALLGAMQSDFNPVVFDFGVEVDLKNPETQVLTLNQAGMGLPQRGYYLDEDPRSVGIREAYVAHVEAMLVLSGVAQADAAASAKAIMAFETELAKIAWAPADLHDPQKVYNPMSFADLKTVAPKFDWDAWLKATGITVTPKSVVVAVPDYVKGAIDLASNLDAKTLQAYVRWHTMHNNANLLTNAIGEQEFSFYGKAMSGQAARPDRWKRCVRSTTSWLPEIVGKYYVEAKFSGDSKPIALGMIKAIEDEFVANLKELEWMDAATATRAVEKMSLITNKIGYPDKWRDYSALTLGTSHLENGMAWRSWEIKRHLAKIDQAPDRGEWFMPASMVNAYYNPTMNEIAFPAGILQPPFFGADRPSALNFGGIGMVVGHEITHGFDDDGRKFDGKGVMTDWWAPEVVGKFEESAQCVEDLYNGYPMLDGLHVDGELTLGENIADLGGLKQAYRAWKKAHGSEPQAIEGLTNDQLYFLGFAQGWCQVQSPEYSAMLLQVDPHSPAKWRVNGAVSQVAEFAEVFSCDAGKPLNPPERCEVW